jgi:hypothetical protein
VQKGDTSEKPGMRAQNDSAVVLPGHATIHPIFGPNCCYCKSVLAASPLSHLGQRVRHEGDAAALEAVHQHPLPRPLWPRARSWAAPCGPPRRGLGFRVERREDWAPLLGSPQPRVGHRRQGPAARAPGCVKKYRKLKGKQGCQAKRKKKRVPCKRERERERAREPTSELRVGEA